MLLGSTLEQSLCYEHCTNTQDIAYIRMKQAPYADDHLHMLSARAADDVRDILNIYNKYTGVSGLHINPSKTELLTINTEQDLTQEIQEQTGISTVSRGWALISECPLSCALPGCF